MSELTDACCVFSGPFEGNILWPYLDTTGKVTIGTGHLLYSDLYAQTLFPGVAVADFAEQWDALKAMPPGRLPSFYETATELRWTPEQSAAAFRSDMDSKVTACSHKVPGFEELPRPAQMVCVDLEYNVGDILKFKGFLAAIAMRNWQSAAINCHRKETPAPGGIQPARNEACRYMILSLIPGAVT